MRFFLFLLLIFYSLFTISNNVKIDSLKKEIKKNTSCDYFLRRELNSIYIEEDNITNALTNTIEGLRCAKNKKNDSLVALFQRDLAYFYNLIEAPEKSLSYSLKAISYFENHKDTINMINCYMDIGYVYNAFDNDAEAIEILEKALHYAKQKNEDYKIPFILNRLGILYSKQNKYELSLKNYQSAIQHINKLSFKKFKDLKISLINNIAYIEYTTGKYKEAIKHIDEIFPLALELNNKRKLLILTYVKASVYFKKNNLDSALKYINMSIEFGNDSPVNNDLAESYLLLSKINESKGKLKESYNNIKNYLNIKDTIDLEKKKNTILKIKMLNKINNKEKEIVNLEYKNKLVNEKLKTIRYRMIFFTILFSLIILFMTGFIIFKLKIKKAYTKIVQSNINEINYKKEIKRLKQFVDPKELKLEDNIKYLNSSLNLNERQRIVELINKKIIDDKIYLDTNITLDKLVEIIGTNKTYLSQVLKENFNTNYTDLINELRIEDAKVLLMSDYSLNYTIDSIASEVGYNSIATFYRAFKKYTGVTPTFFQKNLENK